MGDWLSNTEIEGIMQGMNQLQEKHLLNACMCEDDFLCAIQCSCQTFAHRLLQSSYVPFQGVFPADLLPAHSPESKTLIVNSDRSHQPGRHWLAFYQNADQRVCEFFDSYGLTPSHYPHVTEWLSTTPYPLNYRRPLRIQGPKAYCGAYCIYFLNQRPFNTSMEKTLTFFRTLDAYEKDQELIQTYLSFNDKIVYSYLYSTLSHVLKSIKK